MTKDAIIDVLIAKSRQEAIHVIMESLNIDEETADKLLKANIRSIHWYRIGALSIDDLVEVFKTEV